MMVQLATMFGVGKMKFAPGTWGSAAAALLAYPVLLLPLGWIIMIASVGVLVLLGSRAATAYMDAHRIDEENVLHDPSSIVIDEWAGQWLTYSVWHIWLLIMAGSAEAAKLLLDDMASSPLHLFYGFVLFRFFDVFKPWPISFFDKNVKGGFGVVLDDLVAALFAGTILFAIYFFAPLLSGNLMESTV